MAKLKIVSRSKISDLSKTAGVYFFYEKSNIIYIGKAINIRDRVKNHFSQPSYRDNLFVTKVDRIGYIETNSEIEALVLEANLIKEHLPKFNVVWRDDKNYFYVAITKNEKPVVFITHQKNDPGTVYIGPFIEGGSLKKTLKYLRRVFPYYTSARHENRPCTWCHLELCPGPAPDVPAYQKNIKRLMLVLGGKRSAVLKLLQQEMKQLSRDHDYEKAAQVRDQMLALGRIMQHTRVIERTEMKNNWKQTEKLLQQILQFDRPISRIECYDISNIQGKQAVGSMVVFTNGKPDKSQYRKFRIRMKQEPNDIAMLKEVFERRFSNPQWPYADVMLIDGGIAQLNAAIKVKSRKSKVESLVISIAKGRRELFIESRKEPIPLKHLPQEVYNLIVHLDDEAHRFAISYHKLLRSKKVMGRNA